MIVYKRIWYSLQDSDKTVCKMTVCKMLWYSLQDDSLQDSNMTVSKMTVCKMLWYNLQGIVARHRYDSLQDDSWQDMGMNAVGKNMVHSLNLSSIWTYDHKSENA